MNQLRWYVRRATRPIKFGENRRNALVWSAFPYRARLQDGTPIPLQPGTWFATLPAATAYARREAKKYYGGTR